MVPNDLYGKHISPASCQRSS